MKHPLYSDSEAKRLQAIFLVIQNDLFGVFEVTALKRVLYLETMINENCRVMLADIDRFIILSTRRCPDASRRLTRSFIQAIDQQAEYVLKQAKTHGEFYKVPETSRFWWDIIIPEMTMLQQMVRQGLTRLEADMPE